VSKGPFGRSGATVLAGADVMADGASLHGLGFQNDASDSPEAWARDIVVEGFGLNDERLVKVYVESAGAEVGALVRWGVSVRRVIRGPSSQQECPSAPPFARESPSAGHRSPSSTTPWRSI